MPEFQINSPIRGIEFFNESFFRLRLAAPEIAASARPGQFVMVQCGSFNDPLLRRPLSIHRVLPGGEILLLVRVVGRGTTALAALCPGDSLSVLGPLGRGFGSQPGPTPCLIGGGVGIAPLLFFADWLFAPSRSQLTCPQGQQTAGVSCTVLLGGRNAAELSILTEDFRSLGCRVETATDDGSLGHRGLVTELLPTVLADSEHTKVHACGPWAMMATTAAFCREAAIPCEVSLEVQMACGLGACLGCTVQGNGQRWLHVCKEGPVLNAEEVAWNR